MAASRLTRIYKVTEWGAMPNIATVLKAEIARLARKELRSQTEAHKKALAAHRADIASLKRRVQELERALAKSVRARSSTAAPASIDDAGVSGLRFRAGGMAANRKRLGLSAADFGLLVGATGQSVYSWEQGKTKPRGKSLAAIAALRSIGKREVAKRLVELKQA